MNRREALRKSTLLLGGALSASTIAAVMSGCKAPMDPDWTPSTMTRDQAEIVAEVCERIIPATDTPGAKDALVHRYIDEFLTNIASPEEREVFTKGIQNLQVRSFLKLSDADKDAMLAEMQGNASGPSDSEVGADLANEGEANMNRAVANQFFQGMKQLTITGFFSSEVGAKQVLRYDPIPGEFDGCIDYQEGDVAWAY